MSENKVLPIPNSGGKLPVKVGDEVTLRVSQTCQWCYDDPDHCFPNFLTPGQVTAGDYGPYESLKEGKVIYGCPKDPPCIPEGKTETGHTIIVTN